MSAQHANGGRRSRAAPRVRHRRQAACGRTAAIHGHRRKGGAVLADLGDALRRVLARVPEGGAVRGRVRREVVAPGGADRQRG